MPEGLPPVSSLIFNGLCKQKFKVVQIFSPVTKPVRTKLNVCKIVNMKLFFVNIIILVATKIVIVLTEQKINRVIKNKHEITKLIFSFLYYTIYNANKYQYNLYNFDFLH
jgi:hypothetical protein